MNISSVRVSRAGQTSITRGPRRKTLRSRGPQARHLPDLAEAAGRTTTDATTRAPHRPSATSARRDHQAERQPRPVATATRTSATPSSTAPTVSRVRRSRPSAGGARPAAPASSRGPPYAAGRRRRGGGSRAASSRAAPAKPTRQRAPIRSTRSVTVLSSRGAERAGRPPRPRRGRGEHPGAGPATAETAELGTTARPHCPPRRSRDHAVTASRSRSIRYWSGMSTTRPGTIRAARTASTRTSAQVCGGAPARVHIQMRPKSRAPETIHTCSASSASRPRDRATAAVSPATRPQSPRIIGSRSSCGSQASPSAAAPAKAGAATRGARRTGPPAARRPRRRRPGPGRWRSGAGRRRRWPRASPRRPRTRRRPRPPRWPRAGADRRTEPVGAGARDQRLGQDLRGRDQHVTRPDPRPASGRSGGSTAPTRVHRDGHGPQPRLAGVDLGDVDGGGTGGHDQVEHPDRSVHAQRQVGGRVRRHVVHLPPR